MSILDIVLVVLVVIWLFGWGVFHLGTIIHVLLLVAVVVLVVRLLQGRTGI